MGLVRFVETATGATAGDAVLRDAVAAGTPAGENLLVLASDDELFCD